ncbi:MAG: PQQ-binding-like beta-propeller repeat protein [Planctomycetota bacterium]|nr:PQQ-binding-like beta-propeller repeat protein [Planctomycetota bacterium]
MRRLEYLIVMLALLPTALTSGSAVAEALPSWSQWRGPAGQGHAPAAKDLPLAWGESENVVWKTLVEGKGWSSPVLADGRLWLTTAVETPLSEAEKAERLAKVENSSSLQVSGPVSLRAVCLDATSGKVLHDIELFRQSQPDPIHSLNSYASPSPILDGGRLYCHFGTNGTACVDAASGEIVWSHTLQKIKHENGAGGTPVLFENRLIFDCDGSDQQYIVALDTATGEVAWKTERSGERNPEPQLKKAYGSPIVTGVDGHAVLLSTGADWLYAYDPTDGRELWKQAYGVLGFSIVPRPIVGHGMAYISTSFMQPELLAVKLPSGDALPEIAWRVKKSVPNIPSPILVGDEIVMVSDKGVATCLDADSGEVRFSERLGGNFCSSPLYADGRIWVGNREGQTFILTPGKEFHVEATNQLDGEIMATPIAVGPALFLRTDKAVYRIEKR